MVHIVRELYHYSHSLKDLKENQLHELYVAVLIRTLGISLIGIFIPVYLYQLGYSVQEIAAYFVVLYGFRIIWDGIAARIIGYFGPKHMMILALIFRIVSLLMLLSLEHSDAVSLWMIALVDGVASGLFYLSYHIEFSKIQSAKHGGKQIGSMYKIAKMAGALGPLVGGAIATVFGLQVSIAAAMVLIMASAIPLALSPETIRQRQHVTWRGFPWRRVSRDVWSNLGLGTDQMSTLFIWPLYVSIFIFTENVYLSIGLITSLSLVVSFVFASLYGRVIDNGQGRPLLQLGVMGSSLGHIAKIFINSSGLVYLYNTINDTLAIALRMPYTKGLYREASSYEGYRNAYLATILISSNIVRAGTFAMVYFVAANGSDRGALQMVFLISALTVWSAVFNKFKALR